MGYPEVMPLATYWKYFDSHYFIPYRSIPALSIELGGKTVSIEVEVVMLLHLLLDQSLIEAMMVLMFSISRVLKLLHFPLSGKPCFLTKERWKPLTSYPLAFPILPRSK